MHRLTYTLLFTTLLGLVVPAYTAGGTAGETQRAAFYQSYKLEREGRYAEAITSLTALPKEYLVSYRLGWLHYLKTDYAAAGMHYQAAIKLTPTSIEAKLGYLLPLLAQRRFSEVERVATQILALDGNHYLASLRLAYALRMQQKYAPAGAVLARLLRLYPTDVSVLVEQGLTLTARHQPQAARQLFETVLTLDPTNATATAALGKK
jgi:tetratricopeptide (TPR) repeat protein